MSTMDQPLERDEQEELKAEIARLREVLRTIAYYSDKLSPYEMQRLASKALHAE